MAKHITYRPGSRQSEEMRRRLQRQHQQVEACLSASLPVLLACGALWSATAGVVHAETPLPAGTLPQPSTQFVSSGSADSTVAGNTLTIDQASNKAILNWDSFNVAGDSAVRFNQPGADAAALNRIHSADPSVIQGSIDANGQIYLINQNGILFDQGAQVNVNSLVATSLDIDDEVFKKGLLSNTDGSAALQWRGDQAGFEQSQVRVENGANITAKTGGSVLLLAPTVSNNGKITTPEGQTVLAAGAKVYLTASSDPKLRGFVVEVDPFTDAADSQVNIGGSVTNERLGEIITARGNASLVGYAVNQSGLVRATTSVQRNGSVMLLARDTQPPAVAGQDPSLRRAQRTGALVLGEGSRIEILPETTDAQTLRDDQQGNYVPSTVELMGRTIHVQKDAQIIAPGGKVTLAAQQNGQYQETAAEDVRVYLESGSRIDVSGVEDVAVPVERNIIKVELRGNELKDAPLLRNSPLRNKTVYVDANFITPSGARGTDLADVSGYLGQIPRTAAELAASGGSVRIVSEGDAILRAGSTLDVSGGSAQYQGGQVNTSQLVGEDGRVYNIGSASPDRVYTGIAGTFTTSYAKWGVVNTYQQAGTQRYMPGYLEGKSAGTVEIVAHDLALDSELIGHAITGPYQRTPETTPSGGQLVLGDAAQMDESKPNFKLPDVVFEPQKTLLQDSFTFFSTELPDFVSLTTEYLDKGGFTRTVIYSDGKITVPQDVAIMTAPGGTVALTGRQIDVAGDIRTPGGSIALTTRVTTGQTENRDEYDIQVAADSALDARGGWVNEAPWMMGALAGEPLFIDGGSISINSAWDVSLADGSVIDVSGGGWLRPDGALNDGDAGSIDISTGRLNQDSGNAQESSLTLGATLHGQALGKGGSLSISASKVRIGGEKPDDERELWLAPEFFNQGGFSSYSIKGVDGLTVVAGAEVHPVQESWVPQPGFATSPTGTDLLQLAAPEVLPLEQRPAVNLALSTGSAFFGELVVEQGATLRVDPTGRIDLFSGRGIGVFGTLEAPAGVISLGNQPPNAEIPFQGDVSVWLGNTSQLLASGVSRVITDDFGERHGEVFAGGEISVAAANGTLVVEQGALLDVSGAQAELDLRQVGSSDTTARPTWVASDAGNIALLGREGLLLDGELRGQAGGAGAAGGTLSVTIEANGVAAFPAGPRTLIVRESGTSVPEGLEPGMEIDPNAFDPEASTLNGRAFLSAEQVRAGGFESLALKARDAVEFHGDVALQLSRNLTLDAPVIGTPDGAQVSLDAAYLALGNTIPILQTPRAAGGEGKLDAHGRLIELIGNTALHGFGNASFESEGDLRLRGVYNVATMKSLDGALIAAGDLHFLADQIYPATMSRYTLEVQDKPDGRIVFEGGDGGAPVLSAAGELSVRAPFIEQRGVLKAPFGTISLEASDTLTLGAGSITSVSGDAQLIPFGRTDLGGRDYIYDLGVNNLTGRQLNLIIANPPEKQINLTGATVNFASDAVVDLSGGGDLYAYEFIPGPGGSRDVLDTVGSYAILPALGGEFAPFDQQYSESATGLVPGDSVYLSGVPGLIDGYYPLLPAHYALLPGAFLVTPRTGYTDLVAGVASVLPSGGYLVGGHDAQLNADGSMSRAARSSGFEVLPGATVRQYSEFLETKAGTFFAAQSGVQSPGDAGRLAFSASELLSLDGIVQSTFAPTYRGAEVDISAPRLAVVAPGADFSDADFLVLEADRLNALKAASLLLGGTRRGGSDAVELDVSSEQVVIANDGAHALTAPELLLAAHDRVELREGAVVAGAGTVSGPAKDIRIGFAIRDTDGDGLINDTDENRGDVDGDGVISAGDNIDGNGALLRASAGAHAAILRENVDRSRGTLAIAAGAEVRAAGAIALDATRDNTSQGTLLLGTGGALSLAAKRISLGDTQGVVEGLKFSNAQLGALGDPASLTLHSYSTLDFYGAVALGDATLTNLNLQSAGIVGYANAAQAATLTANTVTLANIDSAAVGSAPVLDDGSEPLPGDGVLEIHAQRIISGDGGDSFAIQGFAGSTLRAEREIVAQGAGGLRVQGELDLQAPRITATTGADQDFTATGALATTAMARPADLTAAALGGTLRLEGSRIDHAGSIELSSGAVSLAATGSATDDAVTIATGARIDAAGRNVAFADTTASSPGGRVSLESAHGDVRIEADALVDVSGAAGGDAGSLDIRAVNGTVQLGGTLKGGAAAGADAVAPRQGGFLLDVGYLNDFSLLNTALNPAYAADGDLLAGGFSAERDLRVRNGDVVIAAADSVQAQRIQLAADHGDIDVFGRILADGAKGGDIALLAGSSDGLDGGRVTLHAGSILSASADDTATRNGGSTGRGGKVLLAANSASGDIELQDGAAIDVSGAASDRDGSVQLRAPRIDADSDVAVSALDATITGASRVTLEAVKVYNDISSIGTTSGAGKLNINDVATDNDAFMANADAITARLGMTDDATFQLSTGVEARSIGNLTLANDWNLATYRAGGEPGVLTLRAEGDLFLNANLSDGFSSALTAGTLSSGESWSYRLVGGADLAAANPLAVADTTALAPEQGNVVLAAGKLVRTGTGAIDVAAARNVELLSNASVIYTAGQSGAALDGFVVPSVNSVRAVFPTGGGDLRIAAQGDINAAPSTQLINDWQYRQGRLNSDGTLRANENPAWWPRFNDFKQGVGALGGGDVSVRASGDIANLSVVIPTNGRLPGAANTVPQASALTVQGGGDLEVRAHGDINSALFYVGEGFGRIVAGGSLGSSRTGMEGVPLYTLFALGDGSYQVTAGGTVGVETVFNPTVIPQATGNTQGLGLSNKKDYFFTYEQDSGVSFTAITGDVLLKNPTTLSATHPLTSRSATDLRALTLYPASLRAAALSGDVNTVGNMALFPAPSGNLELLAQGSVLTQGIINVSDADPARLPQPWSPGSVYDQAIDRPVTSYSEALPEAHSDPILHANDAQPVRIVAVTGNVEGGAQWILPKRAWVQAGQDIRNLYVFGQNVAASDITRFVAGGDIAFDTRRDEFGNQRGNDARITLAGPGRLEIQAGGDVDLGNSVGIQTIGNLNNPFLPAQGADIAVQAGIGGAVDYAAFLGKYIAPGASAPRSYVPELVAYLSALDDGATVDAADAVQRFMDLPLEQQIPLLRQVLFTELKEAGRNAVDALSADYGSYARGYQAIDTLFPGPDDAGNDSYAGDVNLFFSQIKTQQGGDIELLVPGGLVNAGLANSGSLSKTAAELGIVTLQDGSVRALARDDFLVNQSRVFTLAGGDILLWSSKGDIDAGKGAKTASAAPPPRLIVTPEGKFVLDTSQSIAGSGIGVLLTRSGIEAGDVDLIAPEGEVNAGDAGIFAAGNLNIAALRVVGTDNITVGGASLGLAFTDTGGIGVSMSGVSGLGEAGSAVDSATRSIGGADGANPFQGGQAMLTVSVIGFGD